MVEGQLTKALVRRLEKLGQAVALQSAGSGEILKRVPGG